ncbi:MAG: aldehyde dehydrogenase family protein [Deltaproteobacteria bacterium]|nr:aldehyde dehydrogenase family protein [Deltaproteobacteria bacterium]MBI3294541.1 aldehyde dehydrogenase family protein [Deltaproteobacteria bacterium]
MMEAIQEVFDLQGKNRWTVANSTAEERVAKLRRLKTAIIADREAIASAMHQDFRKSRVEVELTEIHPVLEEINQFIKHLAQWMRPSHVHTPTTLGNSRSEVRYESKGRVVILAPWNYPFNLLMAPTVAAIAAGNCVILKPSNKVPHTANCLAKLIASVFEPKEVALFEGGGELGDFLLTLPFDHFFFTGGPRIGKKVMIAAAEHHATVTLELGGKSPVILDEDVDIASATKKIAWGKFLNGGQTCVAPDYAFVPKVLLSQFVEGIQRNVAEFYGADDASRKASVDFPRIVDEHNHKRLTVTIQQTVSAGGRIEFGGQADAKERYIAPTLMTNITPSSPIMQEEIFGPILPVMTYDKREEVIDFVRSRPKPLALYVFSNRSDKANYFIENTTAGGTVVNNVIIQVGNSHLPFGGVGMSGQGNYHGLYGFKTFSHERAVIRQGKANVVKLFYPPYRGKLQRWAEAYLKFIDR